MSEPATGGQQGHDRLDLPPTWTVQSVYDPDQGGKDFAYTVGLDDLGHPELHLWARPGLGEDPGEDWMFSPADRCHILNDLARQLIDGKVGVGSEIVRHYDGGDATVRFAIGPPGDIDELEAYGVAPGALVLPVQWSLSRPPDGPARALTGSPLAAARALRREIVADLDRHRPAPPGWRFDDGVTWRRAQRWGPLTPVVLARAAQLWQADADDLSCLVSNAVDVRESGCLTWPVTVAMASARRAGRRTALAQLQDDVSDLIDHVAAGPGSAPRWSRLKQLIWGGPITDVDDDRLADRSLRVLLVDVALACLCVEAVADVIDPEVLLHGRGAWVDAFEPGDDLPESRWSSPEVIDVVRRLLGPLSLDQLGLLATRHAAARDGADAFAGVTMRLRGWSLVGAAGCPWRPTVGAVPAWREHAAEVEAVARALGTTAGPHHDLREWCSIITSALTHRGRLSAADVHAIARPFRDVLPELERVLNEPVVRG